MRSCSCIPSFRACPHEEKSLRAFLRAWSPHLPLAVEFRPESWNTPHAARILEDHGVAWVWTDQHPLGEENHAGFGFLPVTARHLYLRLLVDFGTKYGPDRREAHRHGRLLWPRDTALEHWTVKIRDRAEAKAIYAFGNKRYEGMGVATARRLATKLGLQLPAEPAQMAGQLELFGRGAPG